jgi:hypothetical protein
MIAEFKLKRPISSPVRVLRKYQELSDGMQDSLLVHVMGMA